MFGFRRRPASRRRNPRLAPPAAPVARAGEFRRAAAGVRSAFARTRLREGDDPRDRGRRGREHRHLLRILRRQAEPRGALHPPTRAGVGRPAARRHRATARRAAGRTGRRARRPAGRGDRRRRGAGARSSRWNGRCRRSPPTVGITTRMSRCGATRSRTRPIRHPPRGSTKPRGWRTILRRAFAGVADAQARSTSPRCATNCGPCCSPIWRRPASNRP